MLALHLLPLKILEDVGLSLEDVSRECIAECLALLEVEAFQNPATYTFYEFAHKIAPRIESVFANTEGPLGQLFEGFLPTTQPHGVAADSLLERR